MKDGIFGYDGDTIETEPPHNQSIKRRKAKLSKKLKGQESKLQTIENIEKSQENHTIESNNEDSELAIYNLHTYDEEAEEEGTAEQFMPIFQDVKGLMYYGSNEEDPNIILKNEADQHDDEREDIEIRPDDLLLVCGRTEDELSHLEVYVYEEDLDNLYVHHDIMLPTFPLCAEWLDFDAKPNHSDSPGNFIAIGSFQPEIEVWDLDVIDPFYPCVVLGKKDGKTRGKKDHEGHQDAVLSLSWNKQHR